MKINLDNCKTSAQAVTKICYNEATRNLDFQIRCQNVEDLKGCVRIIDEYNYFNWKKVNKAIDCWANFKKYYNPNNPNNGQDLLIYEIGRKSSPLMCIKYFTMDKPNEMYQDDGEIKKFTQKLFEKNMEAVADIAKADDCTFRNDGYYKYCRLWWD